MTSDRPCHRGFDEYPPDFWESYAVTDGRICNICESMHQRVFKGTERPLPPYHDGCRCIGRALIAVLSTHKAIIEKHLQTRSPKEILAILHARYPLCWRPPEGPEPKKVRRSKK